MSTIISSTRMLRSVRRYCRVNHISPVRFGRKVVGNAQFVTDLRQGRRLNRKAITLASTALAPEAAPGFVLSGRAS